MGISWQSVIATKFALVNFRQSILRRETMHPNSNDRYPLRPHPQFHTYTSCHKYVPIQIHGEGVSLFFGMDIS